MSKNQPSLFDENTPPWELDAAAQTVAAKVYFAEPPFGPFHYRIPESLSASIHAGMRLAVPLGRGNRRIIGYCTAVEVIQQSADQLKDVLEPIDQSPLANAKVLQLIEWMSRYYLVPVGQVFEAVIPAGVRTSAGSRLRVILRPSEQSQTANLDTLPQKQRQVLQQLILAGQGLTVDQLRHLANCSTGPINALRKAGWIATSEERVWDSQFDHIRSTGGGMAAALSSDQRKSLQAIKRALDSSDHQTILLHGVTGSGKTEVYMQAIDVTISFKRQAIVLVPEISLTPQTRSRFEDRFRNVAVLHSNLSGSERNFQWQRIISGEIDVVIGPRSAIFAPLPHLGLIILDEEHETTFKQETIPRYHARDVALHRAFLERIPLVLGSATPSLETWQRAATGKYTLASLPVRIHNRPLPQVDIIDLRDRRSDISRGVISSPLHGAIDDVLAKDGQVILLLNRRGFATNIQCPCCGFVVTCPDCDLPLTHHRDGSKALCHYCDFSIPTPPVCPNCQHENIRFSGTGTQKLELEVHQRFPDARIARMDSDTMRKPGAHERTLSEFRSGKTNILLGTQMIAKGLDFPNVTLVGVVNADTSLHFPDFRAAERTFQMVTQVAGRTGRGDRGGRVLVQTYSPDHPAIQAACKHDFEMFVQGELEQRKRFGYPPFGYIARIIVRGPQLDSTESFAEGMVQFMQKQRKNLQLSCRILGPAPPPIAKLQGRYRFHILIADQDPAVLNRILSRTQAEITSDADIQYVIDIDPINML